MEFIYTFCLAFILIFLSELGDKTQLLVLSFSSKSKTKNILLGVALGTFFSHGLAILFGSRVSELANPKISYFLSVFTYISFILFGVLGFIFKKEDNDLNDGDFNLLKKVSKFKINYVFIIAISIFIGELGDKTFLSSLGLGLQYPDFKFSLILGCIFGMVASNAFSIVFGKLLMCKLKPETIEFFSNLAFIVFGGLGLVFLDYKF